MREVCFPSPSWNSLYITYSVFFDFMKKIAFTTFILSFAQKIVSYFQINERNTFVLASLCVRRKSSKPTLPSCTGINSAASLEIDWVGILATTT